MRPNGEDLDLAGSFEGLALDKAVVDGRTLPALSGQSDLTIKDGVKLVGSGAENLRGQSGTLRTLALSTGPDTGMTLSGPFSVGADGLHRRRPQGDGARSQGLVGAARGSLSRKPATRSPRASPGSPSLGPAPSLPLKIVKGKAWLGFIPLGEMPPL